MEAAMPTTFRVQFLKNVLDSTGHVHSTCQASIVVEGQDADNALADAQRRFCEARRIPSWRFHADEARVDAVAVAPPAA
jgi:hypothetical protein